MRGFFQQQTHILNRDEIRLDKGDIVTPLEYADDPSMVYSGSQDSQKIVKKQRLLLEVERKCFVVTAKCISSVTACGAQVRPTSQRLLPAQ